MTENTSEKVLASVMSVVQNLYHRYGASTKDEKARDRLAYIRATVRAELANRPELVSELDGAEAAQQHFTMQLLLSMISEQARGVQTPVGTLIAYPKHEATDCTADYPGVYIDLHVEGKDDIMLACVEWLPGDEEMQACICRDGADDSPNPDPIRYYNLDAE